MSLHRLGSMLAAYSLVGLGFSATILLSQRYLPVSAPSPSAQETGGPRAGTTAMVPLASPTPTPPAEVDPAKNLNVILDLLHQEYLSQVNDRALFESSFKLLKEFLKTQKIDTKGLPEMPAKNVVDRASLTASWNQLIDAAVSRCKGKFDRQKLIYLSMKCMLAALNDPYCAVLEPREFRVFEEHMTGGNFSGIGVMIEVDREHKNRITVAQPIEGSPASKAGLQTGDVLEKIDGHSTSGWDIEKAANHIRGPQGSVVQLSLFRPKEKRRFELGVKREMIHVRSCSSKMAGPKIGYISVSVFAEETSKEFEEEVAKVKAQGAEKLVLDLRNNGGGYINAAIDICSHFVDKGETVVSVVNPRLGRSEEHRSLGKEEITWPCVVLVNRFSASASEITAGCLKDHKRAKLVGETTFGKASVQQVEKLLDGGAFKYTVAHYLTPSGKDIHRKGIAADIVVKLSEKDKDDKGLQVAIKTLQDAR